ncbi:hypothetical protein BB558_004243 [Smittium angustum]|uniref:Uncharacterized protein n=1 Tax=Smittium angustum TaxID=133377 RepID=A0A2U1J3W1_SMIAN|nr:hypothetical protein BB558_004243 [Smittium angustum]
MMTPTFDIYDVHGTIKPVIELAGKVSFEPVLPMTMIESFYTILSFIFILGVASSGLLIYPKHKDITERMMKERIVGPKKVKAKK